MRNAWQWIGPLAAFAAAGFSVPAIAKAPHEEQVARAMFEICPKVLSGELDLSDPKAITELGYRIPEADFKRPAVEMGMGRTAIVILGPTDTEQSCSAIFAAPNASLFHKIESIARRRGFEGPPSTALSQALRVLELKTAGEGSFRFSMFDIDAAGGVDFRPMLTAVLVRAEGPTVR